MTRERIIKQLWRRLSEMANSCSSSICKNTDEYRAASDAIDTVKRAGLRPGPFSRARDRAAEMLADPDAAGFRRLDQGLPLDGRRI